MVRWTLRLNGIPALLGPGGDEAVLDRHGALVAARLALAGPQRRSELAALLWPELPPERARANLRQRLLRLRALAGADWIQGIAVLSLMPHVDVLPWQDRALGELLQGVSAPDAPQLDAWLDQVRRQRLLARATRWQQDIDRAEADGQWDEALDLAQHWLATEPQAELPYRCVARLHYLQHDMARAQAVLRRLRAMLLAEFGVAPSAATEALQQLVHRAQAAEPAPPTRQAQAPVALIRPPVLIGREQPLAAVARAWQAGRLAWVTGEQGLGVSRVLQAWCAGMPAGRVLRVSARAGDSGLPDASLRRWLGAWQTLAAELAATGTGAAVTAPPRGTDCPPLAASAERQAWLDELVKALDRSGLAGVVVDQLHDADPASQQAWLTVAEAGALPWLLGGRPEWALGPVAGTLGRLVSNRRLDRVALAPLALEGVDALLQSLALPAGPNSPADAAQTLAARLLAHTGGNPWFILETLQDSDSPAVDGALPRPARVLAALTQRLQCLPASALQLAQVLAVAGPAAGPAAVAAVLGQAVLTLAADWQRLKAAHLAQGITLAHDLAREAVLQTLPAVIAAELHRALALRWEQAAGSDQIEPAHLAWHWQAAGRPGQALPWWLRAADQARAALRPREEAAHLAQAVAAVQATDPPRAVALLLRQARVEADVQGLGASLPPLEQALRLAGDGPQRSIVLKLLAEAQLNRLMPDASARSAEQALALAPLPSVEAAELVVRLHKALCMAGRAGAAEQLWLQHQDWLQPGLLPSAELVSDRAWVLDRLGRVREAQPWHHAALARATADGRPVDAAVVLGNQAQGLLLAGRPLAALQALDRAAQLAARHQGLHQASNYNLLGRASAEHQCGHYAKALAAYDEALVDAAAQSPQALLAVRLRRAGLWADIGQTARALVDLAPVLASRSLPAWTHGRAQALAIRLSTRPAWDRQLDLQALLLAQNDPAQVALDAPLRLQGAAWLNQAGAGEAAQAWLLARQVLRQACRNGHPGLRFAAHWVAAQAALAAGRPCAARRHAAVCGGRSGDQLAIDLPDGQWWHGLWIVWRALGDSTRAETARAAGQAWVRQACEQHVPPAYRASFCDAVPAHRALLASQAGNAGLG